MFSSLVADANRDAHFFPSCSEVNSTVNLIFVGKKGLDAMSALESHPKINAAIKSINAGLKLFCNNFTLYPLHKVEVILLPF